MDIKAVPHPPYSPDLAHCDVRLFPKLKVYRFETIEEMKEAVTKVIDKLTQEDFHRAFQKLLERYNAVQPEETTCEYYQYKCPYEKSLENYLMILI